MAINVADNFSYKGKKAFDARTSYATLALMKAVVDADINEGCMAYCAETDKYYKFLSTNTVDADTGKWREYSSGGGGTTYTAGDGIVIDENDEISTDNMSSSDMEEIIDPLPGVMSRRFKYSTTEQIIGEWIDGNPIYQKTFNCGVLPNVSNKVVADSVISNLDKVIDIYGIAYSSIYSVQISLPFIDERLSDDILPVVRIDYKGNVGIRIGTNIDMSTYDESYVTLQYTKTTD